MMSSYVQSSWSPSTLWDWQSTCQTLHFPRYRWASERLLSSRQAILCRTCIATSFSQQLLCCMRALEGWSNERRRTCPYQHVWQVAMSRETAGKGFIVGNLMVPSNVLDSSQGSTIEAGDSLYQDGPRFWTWIRSFAFQEIEQRRLRGFHNGRSLKNYEMSIFRHWLKFHSNICKWANVW